MEIIISIIGLGNVGKQVCSNLLAIKDHRLIINILDISDTIEGAVLDLQHACELNVAHKILLNNEALVSKSDFVFHCAGASIPINSSRLDVVKGSVLITEEIFRSHQFNKDCKIIVVSNPVEIITHITQKLTAIPSQNVVGTGTYLDAVRMNFYVKDKFPQVSKADFVLLGEHGASVYISEQLSSVNEGKVTSSLNNSQVREALILTKGAAKTIKETQGATIYGVSLCAVELFRAFLKKEPTCIPISMQVPKWMSEQLKIEQIYLSLPAKINHEGAFVNQDYQLDDDEISGLKKSYNSILQHVPKAYLD